ncbi:hypothetical protein CcCBS67573_g09440 [Chytriomyces confervae]|uniref:VHS domain-containing protein n=1 Tax=Chytriomyces confervae TaxID=246404 RepID=A0A507DXL8_9FUNG|nr:hypothetical protein CcCBS67573_g09440 [Chytriomyces confervae]
MVLNLDIADRIKSKQTPANQAARAVKRRLLFKNPNVQLLAMKVSFSSLSTLILLLTDSCCI